jgi:hypothetical protein
VRFLLLFLAACNASPPLADETSEAARLYPDLFTLYAAEHGVYRGCGPSNGVCHNSNEYPNLSSFGSILENIDRGCNLKREDPSAIHDLCERSGDRLVSGDQSSEIAWIELADAATRRWRVHLREPIAMAGEVEVARDGYTLYYLGDYEVTAESDPDDASGKAVLFTVPAPVASVEEDELDFGMLIARSGVLGEPWAIQVGDPNKNGTFGAELGGRIIAPGDPARSYLISRLTDPHAGPLMPRANCCQWTKAALRALYCWIDGLTPDGSNAMAPIDYASCGPGPSVELLYPEPGPACETSGLCPVEAAATGEDDPTFSNVYARVLVPSCSGAECHGSTAPSRLDFSSEAVAFEALAGRVVPGDPDASALYRRLSPELCVAPDCLTMPLGRPVLATDRRALVRAWIELGASR